MRILVALLLLLAATAHAGVAYRWIDQNGNLVFSGTPPSESAGAQGVKTIKLPSTPAVKAPKTGMRPGELEMLESIKLKREAEDKKISEQKATKAARIKNENLANCSKYTRLYESIKTTGKAREEERTTDYRFRNKRYLLIKRQDYRDKIQQYCGK